jgi:hypothetical protein
MAVAEGFEPSVSFPTLAFEASSFGRSDTLPGESLAHDVPCSEIGIRGAGVRCGGGWSRGSEEGGELGGALLGEYSVDHLGAVVEAAVAYDVPQ